MSTIYDLLTSVKGWTWSMSTATGMGPPGAHVSPVELLILLMLADSLFGYVVY
jgi:hypothetical protein